VTLEDYRNNAERIDFARQVAEGNGWDADYVREHFASTHQGQHTACLTCAVVAAFFDVEIVVKPLDSIDTERFSSDLQRSYAERVIDAAVKEQTKDIRERLERLKADLIKMLPRSSNTMSAMRQRDITDFVIERIDLILSVTGTQETDPE
jgi:hypothetical protein